VDSDNGRMLSMRVLVFQLGASVARPVVHGPTVMKQALVILGHNESQNHGSGHSEPSGFH
jgi:hypothetical protein